MPVRTSAAESSGAPRGSHPTPRGLLPPTPPDAWELSNARTQPMPRVRSATRETPKFENTGLPPEVEERRRAERAAIAKAHGLLRAPDPPGSNAGRYSVQDVSAEYVDTGLPEAAHDEETELADDADPSALNAAEPIVYDSEPPPLGEPEADTRPRRSTPKQRVGHRRSSRPELGHARDRGTKRTDPGIRARTLRGTAGASPLPAAKPPTSPLPTAKASPPPLPSPRPPETATVVIDETLIQPLTPPSAPVLQRELSSYVPLPRDREAYEAFLRSAAGEHAGPPRARPSWAQQETALIPRDMLQPSFEDEAERSFWRGPGFKSVLGLALIAISAGVLWWVLQAEHIGSPRATEVAPAPQPLTEASAAVRPITLIATEPTGAELLLDNAVIGNTPLEVTRPMQGEALYIVRLRGFEHQMVRITNATHDAIHITLLPVPSEAPAKRR